MIRTHTSPVMTHVWDEGVVITAQLIEGKLINIRVEGVGERMLCDVVMGVGEALALSEAITSVVMHAIRPKTLEDKESVKVES